MKSVYEITLVRTQFATLTIEASSASEAWDKAKTIAMTNPSDREIYIHDDLQQPDWQVDDVARLQLQNVR